MRSDYRRRSGIAQIVGILVIVWLIIGAIAAGQRGYYGSAKSNCASFATIAVTISPARSTTSGSTPRCTARCRSRASSHLAVQGRAIDLARRLASRRNRVLRVSLGTMQSVQRSPSDDSGEPAVPRIPRRSSLPRPRPSCSPRAPRRSDPRRPSLVATAGPVLLGGLLGDQAAPLSSTFDSRAVTSAVFPDAATSNAVRSLLAASGPGAGDVGQQVRHAAVVCGSTSY